MSATKSKGELLPKHRSQFRLLTSPRFLPLFITQALGAFNDNIFKNALVILITYSATTSLEGIDTQTLVAMAGGIFILPFFLFSATAGQFADKLAKPELVRKVKLAEVIIMLVAALGFALNSTILLFTVLFFLGAQSAIFGPLKYGLLPELLEEEELIGGNALIETATFLVILIGTILGGIIVLKAHGLTIISILCVAFALIGWWTALKIPDRPAASPSIKVDFNILAATFRMVKLAWADLPIFRSIVGISWFWLIGSVFIILFPVFARDVLNGNEQIVAMLLSIFSIGIGIGSLICDKLLQGKVRDYYVPVGALGITLFSADLFFASQPLLATPKGDFIGVMAFLQAGDNWRIVGDLFGISVCGGLYAVPLYAILQARSAPDIRARLIAANNILNALAMVGASAFIFWLTSEGATVPGIILAIGLLNIPITLYVSFVVISAGVARVKKRLKALS